MKNDSGKDFREVFELRKQNISKTKRAGLLDKSLFRIQTPSGGISFFQLVIPLLVELILNNLLNTVNTVVLSGYDNNAVIATGSVTVLFSLISVFFAALATGASVVISNLLGAQERRKAAEVAGVAVLLCLLAGSMCAVIFFLFAEKIAVLFALSGEPLRLAILYMKNRAPEHIFFALSTTLLAVLRCYGHTIYTVLVGLLKNAINVATAYYAVNLAGLPALSGVGGVAIGSMASQAIAFLIASMVMVKKKTMPAFPENLKTTRTYCWKIIKIGVPTCLASASYSMTQMVTNTFAAQLGDFTISVKLYFSNILCYAYLCSSAIGQANSIMTGWLYGARRYEQIHRLNKALLCFSVPSNLAVSLLILALRVPLLSLFTEDPAVFSVAVTVFLLDILIEQTRAFSHIYEYSLRSMGDVTTVMVATVISGWVFGVGLSYLLSVVCGLGIIGFYIGFLADEAARAAVSLVRWAYNRKVFRRSSVQ